MCMYMNNHAQYFKVRVMQSKDSCMLGGGFPKDLGVSLLLYLFIHGSNIHSTTVQLINTFLSFLILITSS